MKYSNPNSRPSVEPPNIDGIPNHLRRFPHWVLWRFDWVEDSWAKVLYDPISNRRAATDDKSTWGSFELVVRLYSEQQDQFDGIGFVFSLEDDLCGIDFDDCVHGGELLEGRSEWLEKFNSYTELSVSGTGLHVIVRGTWGKGRRRKDPDVEVYDRLRYFTVSGRSLGEQKQIRWRQSELEEFKAALFPEVEKQSRVLPSIAVTKSTDELLQQAFISQNGDSIKNLYYGSTSDYGGDDSAADLALCSKLAFWSQGNPAVLDEMFRGSRLYREKWDKRHSADGRTYGQMTIDKALSSCTTFYSRNGNYKTVSNANVTTTETVNAGAPSGIYRVSDLRSNLYKLYESGRQGGEYPGWTGLAKLYSIKKRQFTVITGIPGAGKSAFLDTLLMNLAVRVDWKFAVCSVENQPLEDHLSVLLEIFTGQPFSDGPTPRMDHNTMERALEFMEDHFVFVLPDEDKRTLPGIIELVNEVEADGVVVDPWNELEHRRPPNMTETEYVSQELSKMRQQARTKNQHWWLVAHPTKLQKDKGTGRYHVPTLYDISGCYSDDTEVLTFGRGWVLHRDILPGEKIACFNLRDQSVSWHEPTALTAVDHDGEMYHFNGRSMDCLVTPNHRMVLQPGWSHDPKNLTDPRIRPREWQFVPADSVNSNTWLMPYAAPFTERDGVTQVSPNFDIEVNDFLRFLGWWISEGWISMGGLAICQAEGELADEMEACLTRLGLAHRTNYDRPRPHEQPMYRARIYARKHPEICKWVKSECGEGAPNKKLPSVTWYLSNHQKQILFDALIDGDGSRYDSGNIKYSTTSKQLADDVQRLALELGLPASVGQAEGGEAHHLRRYTVYIGKPSRTSITLSPWQIKRIPYCGKVYCFTVPTGAYVTRRNGRIAFQGNSAHFRNKCDFGLVVWRDTEENAPTTVFVQKVRFRWCGQLGQCDLYFDKISGRFSEDPSVARIDYRKQGEWVGARYEEAVNS